MPQRRDRGNGYGKLRPIRFYNLSQPGVQAGVAPRLGRRAVAKGAIPFFHLPLARLLMLSTLMPRFLLLASATSIVAAAPAPAPTTSYKVTGGSSPSEAGTAAARKQ